MTHRIHRLASLTAVVVTALAVGVAQAAGERSPPPPANPNPLWEEFPLEERPETSTQGRPATRPQAGITAGVVEPDPRGHLNGVLLPALAVATMVATGAWFAWRTRAYLPLRMPHPDQKGASDMRRRIRRNDEPEPDLELDAPRLAGRMEPYLAKSQAHDGQDVEPEQASEPPTAPSADPEPAPQSATVAIGPRVAAVLQAAESAAQEIVSDAKQEAERLLNQTVQDAERLRDETEASAASARAEADEYVANLRQGAEQEFSALRADAEREALLLRQEGEDERDRLVRQGLDRRREMRDATHALEEQVGATLTTLRGIANELDELLAASDAEQEQEQEQEQEAAHTS